MATVLSIAPRLQITPLLDIRHPSFAKLYRDGVYRSLLVERCTVPLTDRYLLENIRACLREAGGDGQQGCLLPTLGFHFGRLHGAILSPQTGDIRSGATTLACFQTTDAARGYSVGREYYFIEALADERTYTDAQLTGRLQEIERESVFFQETEGTWYYALGCILGELSGQLFPASAQEYALWQTDRRHWTAQAS